MRADKRTHKTILLCCLLIATHEIEAQNAQTLVDSDSPAYSYMDSICLELGLAVPNRARPWSISELRMELARIDPAGISKAGLRAWDYLNNLAGIDREGLEFRFDANIALSPEIFTRINLSGDGSYSLPMYDWIHGYEERAPLLSIPLQFELSDTLYAISSLDIREEHATVHESGNYTNLVFDDPNARIDLYFPFKAYASIGGDFWSFRFGRDTISWGNGTTGNLLLSDWSDFYDHLGLSLFGNILKFTWVYAVFDAIDPKTLTNSIYSAFIGHRIDFNLFDQLTVSVNESVAFGSDYPTLVRDLNPFMIFHNWTIPERTNSLLSLEIDYVPWRWFEVYGQAAMDEFTTGYEAGIDGGGGPPVFGALAGSRGTWPIGPGYFSWGVEWVVTSPWLYNRKANPYYYNVRRYYSLTTDAFEFITKPIGYRYGPDVVIWNATAKWDVPDGPGVSITGTWLTRGEKSISDNWAPVAGDIAPSGLNPETALLLDLSVRWRFLEWLEVNGGVAYSSRRTIGNVTGTWSDDIELYASTKLFW